MNAHMKIAVVINLVTAIAAITMGALLHKKVEAAMAKKTAAHEVQPLKVGSQHYLSPKRVRLQSLC